MVSEDYQFEAQNVLQIFPIVVNSEAWQAFL